MQVKQTFVTHHIPLWWAKGQFGVSSTKETVISSHFGKATIHKASPPTIFLELP